MKKISKVLLSLVVVFLIVVVFQSQSTKPDLKGFKIGLLVGTVTQNEEEYRMAEQMQNEFGKDSILIRTYPDKFMQEQETTISQMMALASDPKVKAIVMCQAVPGAAAAADKVRSVRPDILIIFGNAHEDPDMIATKADIVFNIDDLGRGYQIAEQAHKMGAKVMIHYSFPRHMSYEMLSKRRTLMKERALQLGMQFIEVDAPDPTGDAGVPGTQQFINEDVPRQVAKYGRNTAFFGTNCAMQEPMIRQVIATKAIYPVQCCPSPYHALPAALGIEVPKERKGDLKWILNEIKVKVAAVGMSGRISTWPAPINMSFIQVGTYYAAEWINGRTKGKVDDKVLNDLYTRIVGGAKLTNYKNYKNYFMILLSHITF